MLRSIDYLKRKKEKLEEHRLLSQKYKRDTNDPYYHKYSSACKKVISRYEDQITWRHLVLHVTILALLMIAMFGFVAATKNEGSATGHVVDLREIASDTKTVIALIVVVVLVILTIAILAALNLKKAAAIVLILFVLAVAGFVLLGPFEKTEEDILSDAEDAIARAEERARESEAAAAEARRRSAAAETAAEQARQQARAAESEARAAKDRASAAALQRTITTRGYDSSQVIQQTREVKRGEGFKMGSILWVILGIAGLVGGGLLWRRHRRRYVSFKEKQYAIHNKLEEAVSRKKDVRNEMKRNADILPDDEGEYYRKKYLKVLAKIAHRYLENKHINGNIKRLCEEEIRSLREISNKSGRTRTELGRIKGKRIVAESIIDTLMNRYDAYIRLCGMLIDLYDKVKYVVDNEERSLIPFRQNFVTLHKFTSEKDKSSPEKSWKYNSVNYADKIKIRELEKWLEEIKNLTVRYQDTIELMDENIIGKVEELCIILGPLNDIREKIAISSATVKRTRGKLDPKTQEIYDRIGKILDGVLRYLENPQSVDYDLLKKEIDDIKKELKI